MQKATVMVKKRQIAVWRDSSDLYTDVEVNRGEISEIVRLMDLVAAKVTQTKGGGTDE